MRSQTLIHEVLHLHFESAWQFVEDTLRNELGKQADNMGNYVFRFHMETGIDQLAWALTELLPRFKLPGEPEVVYKGSSGEGGPVLENLEKG